MDNEIVIKLDDVSKKYCKSLKQSMFYGISDIGRNMLGLGSHSDQLRSGEFWAVKDVSFEVKSGETWGLIGANGSGKTTLLKMLNGIFWPDKGRVTVRGRVGALIAVGAGFHPLLTGRENIYINGAILGMSRKEIDRKFDAIVEFSGVEDFLDTPVKNYSSGMFVRLGFAVAVFCEPDIFLVDEVLAVGDMNFQRKCYEKINELKKSGCAIILVSHNLIQVEGACEKSLFLNKGKVMAIGKTKEVISEYVDHENSQRAVENAHASMPHEESVHKTGEIVIKSIKLFKNSGEISNEFVTTEDVRIRIGFTAKHKIVKPNFMLIINLFNSLRVLVSSTKVENSSPEFIEGDGYAEHIIKKIPLMPNLYSLDIYIKDDLHGTFYDYKKNAASMIIKVPRGQEVPYRVSGDMGLISYVGEWKY